jgi:restriction system protein
VAIPDYQTLMRPLLQLASKGRELHVREFRDQLAEHFQLTEVERNEVLPSGTQHRFDNRVNWSASDLARAGLLERPARGRYRITEAGREALQTGPKQFTRDWLEPRFKVRPPDPEPDIVPPNGKATPEEELENSYLQLRRLLAGELLDRIKQNSSTFFEQLVVDLLVAMGYGGSLTDAGQAVGKSGDDGIDGIIKEDKLGLDFIYIQAKRWDAPIGRPVVQGFAGSLQGHRARKGVFITTSSFTKEARDFVNRINTSVVLIDGQELAQLMIDHDIGVSTVATYQVKRVDSEYFEG